MPVKRSKPPSFYIAAGHGRNVLANSEVPMSLTPNAQRRRAFLIGRQNGLRSTSDMVDQLQAALEAERAQVAELNRVLAVLQRELFEARLEIARRNIVDAFAAAPSPSAMTH
jgi:hypothetical protein